MLRVRNLLRPLLDTIDPDRSIRRSTLRSVRRLQYRGWRIDAPEKGNELLAEALEKNLPFAAGKLGATESKVFKQLHGPANKVTESARTEILLHSGVFPNDDLNLRRFSQIYLDRLSALDFLAVWYQSGERELVDRLERRPNCAELTALEPYYFDPPWSRHLAGKKVLVVSPFVGTIQRQYERCRSTIWSDVRVLPNFSMRFLKFPHSAQLEPNEFRSWYDILRHFETKLEQTDFDVALVGAGAATMPLAVHAKRVGKIGIGMGGSLQVLFGIAGRRWDQLSFFRNRMNENWVRPAEDETPSRANLVENGAYW